MVSVVVVVCVLVLAACVGLFARMVSRTRGELRAVREEKARLHHVAYNELRTLERRVMKRQAEAAAGEDQREVARVLKESFFGSKPVAPQVSEGVRELLSKLNETTRGWRLEKKLALYVNAWPETQAKQEWRIKELR